MSFFNRIINNIPSNPDIVRTYEDVTVEDVIIENNATYTNNKELLIAPVNKAEAPPKSSDSIYLSDEFHFSGSKARDLMMLFSRSIDLWIQHYHMENVPKRMIFQQALNALNALNDTYFGGKP